MVGKIFSLLCITAVATTLFCSSPDALTNSVFDGCAAALNLTMKLVGVTCFWCGCMNVFEKRGLITKLSRLISPVLKIIFPTAAKTGIGINEISSNVSANLLGIGNAATPLGLNAMNTLSKSNPTPEYASDDMVMLTVLNTSSLDLIPSTLIALRYSCGSARPYDIIIPVIVASFCTSLFAVVITKLLSKVF